MLKKIFAVFFAGMFFVVGANAAVDPRIACVRTATGLTWDNQPIGSETLAMRADYVIYFDNDESDIPSDCESEVDGVVAELAEKQGDIDAILMFGSADSVGDANHNAKLARDRVNTVANRLKNDGRFTDEQLCEYDGSERNVPSSRCARVSIGDSVHRTESVFISDKLARAVFLYVIYKSDICDASTIKVLEQLAAKVPGNSDLKSAKELCKAEGDLLLRSQRQQVMAAIQSAIDEYPEIVDQIDLPQDEKIRLLMNSLIYVRNDAIENASVWTAKNGGFNYARLASDSVAGVVLGTAGGLITSNIVKKNQLSSGFDSVMCTIGGQTVASYGDEFRVGITTR